MQYVLECRWISGERFGRAQDKWWPGNWSKEGEREAKQGVMKRDSSFQVCTQAKPVSYTLIMHTHISPWKPAAPVCEIGPLLYPHTFPHPQPPPLVHVSFEETETWNAGRPSHDSSNMCQTCMKDAHSWVHILWNRQCDWLVGMWYLISTYTATRDTSQECSLCFCLFNVH